MFSLIKSIVFYNFYGIKMLFKIRDSNTTFQTETLKKQT